jgi:hypothetical protein
LATINECARGYVVVRLTLLPDPAPILALGAAVAWVSLVTVEFYERIYRQRIEQYAPELRALGDARFNKIV